MSEGPRGGSLLLPPHLADLEYGRAATTAYIELHQAVFTHRKTIKLAGRLGIPKVSAVAHLAALWCWCLDNAQDGDLSELEPEIISEAAQWLGESTPFVDALIYAGYVDEIEHATNASGLELHDWAEYGGKLIRSRAVNAARMRNAREGNVQRTSESVQRTNDGVRPQEERRGEERRVEEPGPPPVPLRGADVGHAIAADARASTDGGGAPGESSKDSTPPKPKPSPTLARLNDYRRELAGWPKLHPLNPAQILECEKLIEEVGEDRFREGLAWLVARSETDMGKAGRWARTKMRGGGDAGNGNSGRVGSDGLATGRANGRSGGPNGRGGHEQVAPSQFAYYSRPHSPSARAPSETGDDPRAL